MPPNKTFDKLLFLYYILDIKTGDKNGYTEINY